MAAIYPRVLEMVPPAQLGQDSCGVDVCGKKDDKSFVDERIDKASVSLLLSECTEWCGRSARMERWCAVTVRMVRMRQEEGSFESKGGL